MPRSTLPLPTKEGMSAAGRKTLHHEVLFLSIFVYLYSTELEKIGTLARALVDVAVWRDRAGVGCGCGDVQCDGVVLY
jgi:hypothetical protein